MCSRVWGFQPQIRRGVSPWASATRAYNSRCNSIDISLLMNDWDP